MGLFFVHISFGSCYFLMALMKWPVAADGGHECHAVISASFSRWHSSAGHYDFRTGCIRPALYLLTGNRAVQINDVHLPFLGIVAIAPTMLI